MRLTWLRMSAADTGYGVVKVEADPAHLVRRAATLASGARHV